MGRRFWGNKHGPQALGWLITIAMICVTWTTPVWIQQNGIAWDVRTMPAVKGMQIGRKSQHCLVILVWAGKMHARAMGAVRIVPQKETRFSPVSILLPVWAPKIPNLPMCTPKKPTKPGKKIATQHWGFVMFQEDAVHVCQIIFPLPTWLARNVQNQYGMPSRRCLLPSLVFFSFPFF